MEENNIFYSVKDLVFGSRGMYLNNLQYLNILRSLVVCNDKNVSDFYFELKKIGDSNPELICRFVQSLGILSGIFTRLKFKNSNYYNGDLFGECLQNEVGSYIINNDMYDAFVKHGSMDYFSFIVDKILKSDFVNKMNFDYYWDLGENAVMVAPNGICIENDYFNQNVFVGYYPREDLIGIKCNGQSVIDDKLIINILNSKVSCEFLSTYHKGIINNSISLNKPIQIVNEVGNNRSTNYRVEEDRERIVLRKIKSSSKFYY